MKQLCYKKEIPILFSTEMVWAIIDGRKTQTRRIVKPQPPFEAYKIDYPGRDVFIGKKWVKADDYQYNDGALQCPTVKSFKCPYGKPGDLLWVREEHYRFGHWEKNGFTKTGKQKWKFVGVSGSDIYFDGDQLPEKSNKSRVKGKEEFNLLYKRLARFLPKSAARIWLEVKEVRVERLQDIQYDDAMREGIDTVGFTICDNVDDHAKRKFQILWQSINGEESWRSNPWVWVISFKVLSTAGKPTNN